jgi:entry exclusion lipoprotein TrbK
MDLQGKPTGQLLRGGPMKRHYRIITLIAVLSGCSENAQQIPEPSRATCDPQAMKKIIADLSDAQKESFIAACKSWQKARNMKDWTYKPSAPDSY